MKRYLFPFLLVILLTACASPATQSAPAAANPTATEIPSTETPAPTSTTTSTPTTAPTETPAPTGTPAATPTYDFTIMSIHDQMIDGLIPLEMTDAPLTEACGAPIFDKAIAGSGDPTNMYYFMTDSNPMDVYQYYMTEMPAQGSELIRISDDMFNNLRLSEADLSQFHSSLQFMNASSGSGVSITITKDFDNGHIYIWMICSG